MKTIKSLKDITTLEVGDKVVFGDLVYKVTRDEFHGRYYLIIITYENDRIFNVLNINKQDFIEKLGIKTAAAGCFPETYSLEALTALVSALFKEYEKQNQLPKTWEEFCAKNKIKKGESYINRDSQIKELCGYERDSTTDRNVCISKQDAEAFLAMMQLRQLRKAYVKDWEPDWTNDSKPKHCVYFYGNHIKIDKWGFTSQVLSFPNYDLAEQFLTNFKDLIEIAKPLI